MGGACQEVTSMQLTEELFTMHLPELTNVTVTGLVPLTTDSTDRTNLTLGLCYYEGIRTVEVSIYVAIFRFPCASLL